MRLDLNYEELNILEGVLEAEIKRAEHALELLEKFGHDDIYEWQERQIALMNALLEKLNIIREKSFE